MQAKSTKNAGNPQTQAENNNNMKKYKTYQYIAEASQMPDSNIN